MLLPNSHSFRPVIRSRLVKSLPVAQAAPRQHIEIETEVDSSKRNFLRLAGIAGLGVVASQVLPGKAEAYVLGKGGASSNTVGIKNTSNTAIDPATESTLSSVKTKTDKLTFDGGNNLYVQAATNFASQIENASAVVINPATEDSLSAVKTQLNKLTFDGSNNLLTAAAGGAASAVGIKDTDGIQIDPVSDDSVVYLRRLVKLMESQAVVDSGNRQRITIDSIGAGTAITTTIPVTATLAAGTAVAGSVLLDGQGRQMFTEIARQAYNSGIRSSLIFS